MSTEPKGITHILWSADGERLTTSSIDGDINVWDVVGDRLPKQIGAHHGHAFQCDWSPDEKLIISVGQDNLVRMWDADSGQQISRLASDCVPSRLQPVQHRALPILRKCVVRHAPQGNVMGNMVGCRRQRHGY